MKSFRRSLKGISPIFATLILIAIAVIAGVVVYMFTSGMLSGMTSSSSAGQEKIAVQSSGYTDDVGAGIDVVTIYAQQTGGPAATVKNIIIKNSSGNTVWSGAAVAAPADATMTQGTLYKITGTGVATTNPLELGSGVYTATLVTAAGGSFVSPSFTVS